MAEEVKILIKVNDEEIRKAEELEDQIKGLKKGDREDKGSTQNKGFFKRNIRKADGTVRGRLGGIAQNLGAQANPFAGNLRSVGAGLTLTSAILARAAQDDPTGLLGKVSKIITGVETEFNKRLDRLNAEFAGRQKAFDQIQDVIQAVSILGIDPKKSGLELTKVANILRLQNVGEFQSSAQIKRELFKKTVKGLPLEDALNAARAATLGDLKDSFMAVVRGK